MEVTIAKNSAGDQMISPSVCHIVIQLQEKDQFTEVYDNLDFLFRSVEIEVMIDVS